MNFFREGKEEDAIWIDRGIDSKVDRFEPCEVCNALLTVRTLEDSVWQELSLCNPCTSRLEVESAIAEVRNERPYNLDREVETIVATGPFLCDKNSYDPDEKYLRWQER